MLFLSYETIMDGRQVRWFCWRWSSWLQCSTISQTLHWPPSLSWLSLTWLTSAWLNISGTSTVCHSHSQSLLTLHIDHRHHHHHHLILKHMKWVSQYKGRHNQTGNCAYGCPENTH